MVGIGALIAGTAIQTNRASDVLARNQEILGKATTVVGSFTQQIGKGVGKGDFHLKKDKKIAVFSDSVTDLCDGFFRTTINRKDGTYKVQDVRVYNLLFMPGFEAFTVHNGKTLFQKFNQDAKDNNQQAEPRDIKMTRMDGKSAVSYIMGGSVVYIDTSTALPLGVDFNGENGQSVKMRFQDVRLNVELDDNMFTYKAGDNLTEERTIETGMLKAGDTVPSAFDNEALKMLDKFSAGKKHTVVFFFDRSNAAVGDVIAKFDKIAKQRLPKDVAIVGVSQTSDWQNLFRGKPKHPLIVDAPLASDSMAAKFGITKRPTIYIIDENRKVEFVQIGSDSADLDEALIRIGIKNP